MRSVCPPHRVAAFLVAMAACADPPGEGRETVDVQPTVGVPAAAPQLRIDLRADALRSRFLKPAETRPRHPRAPVRSPTSLFGESGVFSFATEGDALVPTLPHDAPTVRLPPSADAMFEIRAQDGFGVRARLVGAAPAARIVDDGLVVYPSAVGPAGDLVHRVSAAGTEDFVIFATAPAEPTLTYEIDVSAAAGLRLIGSVLELLDADGVPRARVRAPAIVEEAEGNVAGRAHRLAVSVPDCEVDRDPRGPWDRPVVDPGSETCHLVLRWDGAAVRYPAVVDPSWSTVTNDMVEDRGDFGLVTLQSGRVLAAGGGWPDSSTCEIFDPATLTWSTTASMLGPHSDAKAIRLVDGRVLVDAGDAAAQDTDIFDPLTSTWSAGAPLGVPRLEHSVEILDSGKVLVIGGDDPSSTTSTAEVYDPASDTWTATSPMTELRVNHRSTKMLDGRVLAHGGYTTLDDLVTAEIYDPTTNAWTAAASMTHERSAHLSALLPDGKVLAAVGWYWPTAEIYDPQADSWAFTTGGAINQNAEGTATILPSGSVLIVGGYDVYQSTEEAQLYDFQSGLFVPTLPMQARRLGHSAVALGDGRVVIAGGFQSGSSFELSEIYSSDASGTACFFGAECDSGYCIDSFCCDQACDGPCMACTTAKKGSGVDGVCEPVASGTDPKNGCPAEGASTCGTTGSCDGLGSCVLYPQGTLCGDSSCADAVAQGSSCNGAGTCVQVTTACAPFACAGAGCSTSCNSDAGCDETGWCFAELGECTTDFEDGEACNRSAQCASNSCVDGACSTFSACSDLHTYVQPDGTSTDCAPYACGPSGCFEECNSLLQCASPNVCHEDGTCGVPTTAAVLDGCSAAAGPGPTREILGWLIVAAALSLVRRRSASARKHGGSRS